MVSGWVGMHEGGRACMRVAGEVVVVDEARQWTIRSRQPRWTCQ